MNPAFGPLMPMEPTESMARRAVEVLTGSAERKPPTTSECFNSIAGALVREDAAANADLVAELRAMQHRVCQRLDEQKTQRLQTLQQQHDEVYEQCRGALDNLHRLQNELGQVSALVNGVNDELGRARAAESGTVARRPHPSTYPTAKEMEAWCVEVLAAEQRVDEIRGRLDITTKESERLARRLKEENDRFVKLQQREKELSAKIAGRPYYNELGLLVEAE
jgi:hypothetical protein